MKKADEGWGDNPRDGRGAGRTGGDGAGAEKPPRSRLDPALKQKLAIRAFVEDLLLAFLREKASKLVLATMKRRPGELTGPGPKHLYADAVVIAEVRGQDGVFAYVHFEFQDRNDRKMPERMMRYEDALRWAPLAKSEVGAGKSGKPPRIGGVLSVVLYTGRAPWTVSQYRERESGGEPWPEQQPPERYELVDLLRSPCDDLDGTSVWAVVQQLLRAEPEDVLPLWRELMRRAAAKGGEEGCLAAGALVEELLRPLGLADKIRAANRAAAKGDGEMPEGMMLEVEDHVTAWRRTLLEKGRAEGEQKGERRGRKEARAEQAAMLLRFAEWKFGPEAAEALAGVAASGEGPNGLSLTRLSDWIIDCDTMEELLERLENGAE